MIQQQNTGRFAMLLNKCFLFIFVFGLFSSSVLGISDVYVDDYILQEAGKDNDEDDIAEISSEDCSVTCTDSDTQTEYTLRAYIKAMVYDELNDKTSSSWYVEYKDSTSDDPVELYYFNRNEDYEDTNDHRRTAQARFFPWYEHESVFNTDLQTILDAYSKVSIARFFPLLFESFSIFEINSNEKITHSYSHKINYDPCPGKYIEIDACANDGGSSSECAGLTNTALVSCYIHYGQEYGETDDRDINGDGIIHLRAYDSEDSDA